MQPRTPRGRALRVAAVAAAFTLVAAACNGDDDAAVPDPFDDTEDPVDTTTTLAPEIGDPDENGVPDDVDDPDFEEAASLDLALRSTLESGSADYTIRVDHGRMVAGTDDGAAGTDDTGTGTGTGAGTDDTGTGTDDTDTGTGTGAGTDDTGTTIDGGEVIEGRVDFDQRLRAVTLEVDTGEREIVVEHDALYVEIDEDDGIDWARVDLGPLMSDGAGQPGAPGTDGASPGAMSTDLLVALHDPGAILAAIGAAQTGMAQDDAGTAPPQDSEGWHEQVTVQADQLDDPITEMMVRQFGDAGLDVQVWFSRTNDANGADAVVGDDDGAGEYRIDRIEYVIPDEATPTTEPAPGVGTVPENGEAPVPGATDDDELGTTDDDELGTTDDDGLGTTEDDGLGTTDDDELGTTDDWDTAEQLVVIVEFDNFGGIDDIDRPDHDDVRDLELAGFAGTFTMAVLPGLAAGPAIGSDPGSGADTGTDPTTDADIGTDDAPETGSDTTTTAPN